MMEVNRRADIEAKHAQEREATARRARAASEAPARERQAVREAEETARKEKEVRDFLNSFKNWARQVRVSTNFHAPGRGFPARPTRGWVILHEEYEGEASSFHYGENVTSRISGFTELVVTEAGDLLWRRDGAGATDSTASRVEIVRDAAASHHRLGDIKRYIASNYHR